MQNPGSLYTSSSTGHFPPPGIESCRIYPGETAPRQVAPDGSRAHRGLDLKAFPRGRPLGEQATHVLGELAQPSDIEESDSPWLRPHFTDGATSAELWAFRGAPPRRGRLFLRGGGCARHRRRGNFHGRLEPGHFALQFGREVFKDS